MLNKLKFKIANGDGIYAKIRILLGMRNRSFVEEAGYYGKRFALKFGRDTLSENEETFYLLNIQPDTGNGLGFGAFLRWAVMACFIAEKFHMIPYVIYKNDMYGVKGGYKGTDNIYEYYFNQYREYTYEKVIKSNYFIFRGYELRLVSNTFNSQNEKYILAAGYQIAENEKYFQEMGRVFKKYITIKPELEEQFRLEMREIGFDSGKKVIGIQIRGTAFYSQQVKGHPIPVYPEDIIEKIDKEIDGEYDLLFVATDDENNLKALQKRYGDKIICFRNTLRNDGAIELMDLKENRKDHRYLLGREVIRDMYALSYCDLMVAGLSQVSIMARVMNASHDIGYDKCIFIDKGVHQKTDKKKMRQYHNKKNKG